MLGSIATLKQQLKITDDTRDDALESLLSAASLKVLDRCGYSEKDVTDHVQYFRKLKYNRTAQLELRAVENLVIEGRPLGAANEDWTALVADVLDPQRGTFVILGAQNWWPPTQQIQPRYMRWRDPEWPIIRATYNVVGVGSGLEPDDDLIEAAYALADHWLRSSGQGIVTREQIGQIAQEYATGTLAQKPVPPKVEALLTRHTKGLAATWR